MFRGIVILLLIISAFATREGHAQSNSIHPVIFENFIVKTEVINGNSELILHDWKKDLTYRFTNNDYDDIAPFTSNKYLIWKGMTADGEAIFVYDAEEENLLKISCDGEVSDIRSAGNKVSWICKEEGKYILEIVDIPTLVKTVIPLRTNSTPNYDLNAYSTVWQDIQGEDQEIFTMCLTDKKIVQVTNNDVDDITPVLNDQFISWNQKNRIGTAVMLYNRKTGLIADITQDDAENIKPMISDRFVFWQKDDGAIKAVYKYDLYSGNTTMIAENAEWNESAQLLNDYIIWYCKDDDKPHYCFYDLKRTTLTQYAMDQEGDAVPLVNGSDILWHHSIDFNLNDLYSYR